MPAEPSTPAGSRRLIAAGIRRGRTALIVEPVYPQSPADRAAHEAASYVRRPAKVAA